MNIEAAKIFEAYDMFSIADVMRTGDVYMEIGAHKGRFLENSGLLRDDCKYLLYEPGPVKAELGQKYVARKNVIVLPEAIWSTEGEQPYHTDTSEGQGNTLASGVHTLGGCVRTITLEQAFLRHGIDTLRFLAINAEQAEYEILKSPAMARVDFVTVEFHPGKSGINTREFVREHLPRFETLKFGREGDAYNMWLARRT